VKSTLGPGAMKALKTVAITVKESTEVSVANGQSCRRRRLSAQRRPPIKYDSRHD
jgi:hypothetical protein